MGNGAYDAVVVGAGPNGLAAAIVLAQSGWSVLLVEAQETVGGGCRSAELTLPGFLHDHCSAIHPLGVASPLFRSLSLEQQGLEWIEPPIPLAHPLDDGTAVVLEHSVVATAAQLGPDADAYQQLMNPLVTNANKLLDDVLAPLHVPSHPIVLARFGLDAIRSATGLATAKFRGERARSLFAGLAAHSLLPLDQPPSAAFGLVLGMLGHAVGWPLPRGGSQRIADALASHFRALGGEIVTGTPVTSLDELPGSAWAIVLDLTPRQVVQIAGDRLPRHYLRQLERYRYGPGVFKVDWALDAPIPWTAEICSQAGTVHLGGTMAEVAAAERSVAQGTPPARPFVLLAQQSLFDPTRAPDGQHTAWAYCHVPNGSKVDMTECIEAQVERYAPGFRKRILARSTMSPADLEQYSANYVGGDINGGIQDLRQLFTRPVVRLNPYTTPDHTLYLCSSSTPPGGGVHGMCGYHAAQTVLQRRR